VKTNGTQIHADFQDSKDPSELSFLKDVVILLNLLLLHQAFAEIPPFPPLKKGGGGGIEEGHCQKISSYRFFEALKYLRISAKICVP